MSTPPSSQRKPIKNMPASELAKDPKFIKFTAVVERTLTGFEAVAEWADVSSFLNKLLKSFEAYPQFNTIPHKLLLAKRLAQCLNPALPTGVHQKALSVYACVFQKIGNDNLAMDLPIYAYGLFPCMQYASMNIKPQLIGVYEKYILPLGQTLRPSTKSLLLAILPGIEEEGNEYFENVLFLLDLLCQSVGQSHYFQCIWLTILTSPKARQPALNFLSRRFPSVTSPEDVAFVLGNNSGLMVQAICASLEDKDPLVKRGILDLLVKFVPLQNKIISPTDLITLVKAVLSIFLLRDMSLNRRVYAWFLGEGESPEAIRTHLSEYSLDPISMALQEMLKDPNPTLADIRNPYSILIYLMDRPELGPLLLEMSFNDLLKAAFFQFTAWPELQNEVLQATGQFLETIDQYVVWASIYKDIKHIKIDRISSKSLEFYCFVIQALLTNTDAIEFVHLQCFSVTLLGLIKDIENKERFLQSEPQVIDILKMGTITFSRLPKDIFLIQHAPEKLQEPKQTLVELIDAYYGASADRVFVEEDLDALSFCAQGKGLFQELSRLVEAAVLVFAQTKNYDEHKIGFQLACGLLKQLTSFRLEPNKGLYFSAEPQFQKCATSLIRCCLHSKDITILTAAITSLVDLSLKGFSSPGLLTNQLIYGLLDRLWDFLHPVYGENHARVVELIWSLGQVFPLNLIEAHVARRVSIFASNIENFGWFWKFSIAKGHEPAKHFSQPLFVIIDALSDESVEVKQEAQAWLRTFLNSYPEVFNVVLDFLINKEFRRIVSPKLIGADPSGFDLIAIYETIPDLLQAEYLLSTLLNLTRSEGIKFIHVLETTQLTNYVVGGPTLEPQTNYLIFFVQVMMAFLATELSPAYGSEKMQQCIKLYCTIGQILQRWLPSLDPSANPLYPPLVTELLNILHNRLAHFIVEERMSPQVELLPVLSILKGLPASSFLPIDPSKWKDNLVHCSQHRFYPLAISNAQEAAESPPSVPHIISSLVLLSITEVHSGKTLQYWCDIFLSITPSCTSSSRFQEIVVPVLDYTLEKIRRPSHRNDVSILIDFACQMYRSLLDAGAVQLISPRVVALMVALAKSWAWIVDNTSGTLALSQTQEKIVSAAHCMAVHFPKEFHGSFVEAWLDTKNNISMLIKVPDFSLTSFFQDCLQLARKSISESSGSRRSSFRSYTITDLDSLEFLEALLSQLHTSTYGSLNSTWAPLLTFYKDTLYNLSNQKYLLYPLLRLYQQYSLHAGAAESIGDRKLKRDAQDTFQKLLDQLLTVVCKPLDQSSWLKLSTSRGQEDFNSERDNSDLLHVKQVMGFVDIHVLPMIQKHLVDNERVVGFLSNLVYYFIGPSMGNQHPCHKLALSMLKKICDWDFAFRCWKREVWDAFFDSDFFDQDPQHFETWIKLMQAALAQEKEKLPEVITKIATTPLNLFTSREAETLNRAMMLRRLSFLVFCGLKDNHIVHLPLIQEKIVELIKSNTPVLIQIEVTLDQCSNRLIDLPVPQGSPMPLFQPSHHELLAYPPHRVGPDLSVSPESIIACRWLQPHKPRPCRCP
ncbi:hypothetical protein DSO57_1022104 [Entomophthora muscae]|uniref:Uncharacterized protein n=1 Tax=Entomophthora muscae TaxID=34485 RepID=A0ACC2T3C6_9FUNG|nr:hypothetical protein DSO57_1022104 [Entomophthora muscae]